MNPHVDSFFDKPDKWQKEYRELRRIALDCGLMEELKWRHPCYTLRGNNIILIHGFKDYCALLFFKGALLQDTNNILIQQTAYVQSARQKGSSILSRSGNWSPSLKRIFMKPFWKKLA